MAKEDSSPEKSANFHSKRLYRSQTDRVIAGVAGGLGEYFDIDSNLIRVLFVLTTIFGGSGILFYLALWIILPSSQSSGNSEENVHSNAREIKQRAEEFAHGIRGSARREDSRFWWGLLIMVLGFLFLFSNFGLYDFFNVARLWPLALIAFGLAILFR